MPADPTIYQSSRMAESYARSRPPVHRSVCKRLIERISPNARLRNALDAGCGAGASTAALLPYVDQLTGLDPYPGMLRQAAANVASACFIQGRLESLPFGSSSFQYGPKSWQNGTRRMTPDKRKRLQLMPFRCEDARAIYSFIGDPATMKFTCVAPTIKEHRGAL